MERPAAASDMVMGAGVERRGHPTGSPLSADGEASRPERRLLLLVPLLEEHEAGKGSHCSKAPAIILGLVFLEVVAFYGVYLNLVVYLQDVLHGDTASNAAAVNFWAAASYLMPVVGVAIADSFWGKYKTVLVGFSTALTGMAVITTSAAVPSLRPPPCEQSTHCAPATLGQRLVFSTGVYLCAVGVGAAKAAIASFGAEQFGDDAAERERKASYFSWYYGVGNLGILTAGTLLVWVEDKVSWGLGFGVCASFLAAAVLGLATTAPLYRMVPPAGSPLKGVCQVLVAFAHKVNVSVPDDASELYEEEEHVIKTTPLLLGEPVRERLEHTDQFRCLDKAAVVVTAADLEGGRSSWRLCTVTQVEELKTLLRLVPIWLTAAVYFVANSQAQTTFVQQATMTDPTIASVSVPAASLTSVETVFAVAAVALYNGAVAPAARRVLGRAEAFTPLQLMGLGHAAVTVAVGVAACVEARRLDAARAGAAPMSIAWLLPQYVAMAVSDAALGVGHFDFFYDQAPETMKGASTAFYFLSISLGNLLSSQLVKLVAAMTGAGERTGWFPSNMDDGHLDYYYLLIVGITAVNFAVFVYLAKNYTPKRVGRL